MVQLRERRVLERVAPPQVRMRGWGARVERTEELGARRREAGAHARELVVDEAGVEACDKGAGEDGGADEGCDEGCGDAEGPEVGGAEAREEFEGAVGLRVQEEVALAEDLEGVPGHGGEGGEGEGEVRR